MIIKYRYEHPNAIIARTAIMSEIQKIITAIEQGANDPYFEYSFEGLSLSLEYEVDCPFDAEFGTPWLKRFLILDGHPIMRYTLLDRLEAEANLLKSMGYQFERWCVTGEDGQRYFILPTEVFDSNYLG